MHMHEFLKALPKVSLHVHLMGSVQAQTAVDLCAKHNVPLPDYEEPEDLYDYPDIYKFLHLYDNTALAVQDREDFRRIAYETLTEAAENNVALPRDVLQPDHPHGRRRLLRDLRRRPHRRHQGRPHRPRHRLQADRRRQPDGDSPSWPSPWSRRWPSTPART